MDSDPSGQIMNKRGEILYRQARIWNFGQGGGGMVFILPPSHYRIKKVFVRMINKIIGRGGGG